MNFSLIGLGYIASRHLKAIKDTNNQLIACMDKSDAAGVLDGYFPNVPFFSNFEEFVEFGYLNNTKADYLSVCSPNCLHKTHAAYGLCNDMNVICEKPTTLSLSELDTLQALEEKTGRNVYSVVQLRLHPAVIALKEKIQSQKKTDKKHKIKLNFVTHRGPWYFKSWKVNESLSGGVLMNLGIHFFDLLLWIFGEVKSIEVKERSVATYSGYFELENAEVEWLLSIDSNRLPAKQKEEGKTAFKSFTIDGEEFSFDGGVDLHTAVYKDILAGNGFTLRDVRPGIELVERLMK